MVSDGIETRNRPGPTFSIRAEGRFECKAITDSIATPPSCNSTESPAFPPAGKTDVIVGGLAAEAVAIATNPQIVRTKSMIGMSRRLVVRIGGFRTRMFRTVIIAIVTFDPGGDGLWTSKSVRRESIGSRRMKDGFGGWPGGSR